MAAPCPQDLVDRMRRLADVHTQETIAQICGVTKRTVHQAKKRGWRQGAPGPELRAMPGDYRIQRDHLTLHELARHYRTGLRCIWRWEAEAGAPRAYRVRPRPDPTIATPPDLAEVIARLGIPAAAKHFGVHENTLRRMRRQSGLVVRRYPPSRTSPKETSHG